MTFLINATNLNEGGGIQVTQSLCGQLNNYPNHTFIVVLSSSIDDSFIKYGSNTKVYRYNIKDSFQTLLLGRDELLDAFVEDCHVDAVLTIFGPSIWKPKVPHLCGFARAQLVIKDSPYNKIRTIRERIRNFLVAWFFKKCSRIYYTENAYISAMLPKLLGNVKVYTVTNFYNQIYDHQEHWKRNHTLPKYNGITCLTISTYYPHKNYEIIVDVIRELQTLHPEMKVRFVVTLEENQMFIPNVIRDSFVFVGKIDVSECPYLYEQCDIMFMPTLLECFTATYPEAMRMNVPIVTTDLEFARGLCGNAACYYSAVDPRAAAEAIYKVATDKKYSQELVDNGKRQLLTYDNYEQRADKLIGILEEISKQELGVN